jgi:phospholipid transport system substrate-binding protein
LAEGLVLVKSQLDFPGRGVDLYTDYRLREGPNGWRVVDIHEPPAVSDVAMRRSEYAAVLERGGFDELVAMMKERLARRAEQ